MSQYRLVKACSCTIVSFVLRGIPLFTSKNCLPLLIICIETRCQRGIYLSTAILVSLGNPDLISPILPLIRSFLRSLRQKLGWWLQSEPGLPMQDICLLTYRVGIHYSPGATLSLGDAPLQMHLRDRHLLEADWVLQRWLRGVGVELGGVLG